MLVEFPTQNFFSVAEYMSLMILDNEDPGEMCVVLHLISFVEKKKTVFEAYSQVMITLT